MSTGSQFTSGKRPDAAWRTAAASICLQSVVTQPWVRGHRTAESTMATISQAWRGVEDWHGASPGSGFAYIAVTPTEKGKTIWSLLAIRTITA